MTTEHGIRASDMTTEDELQQQTPPTGNGVGEPDDRETRGATGDTTGDTHGATDDTTGDTGRMRGADDAESHGDGAAAQADGTVSGAASGTGGTAAKDGEQSPSLMAPDRAVGFQKRWDELKADFVDDPRHTVQQIDGLVGDVLDEVEQVFRRQRADLEAGLSDEGSSTEDLRVAIGRYREFFDRLLKF
ncbi:MAG TPA: hypothetical protein VGP05_16180 [Pseudonocardia sp.]|jgi:hypothetical protein|nr:hypothetical protein [Pseudonocardia sp.]